MTAKFPDPMPVAAILPIVFAAVVNVTPDALRNNKLFVPSVIAAFCVTVPAVCNVNTPGANVETGAHGVPETAILIFPAVLFPIATFVPNTLASCRAGKSKLPVPPAIPIVLPDVEG